MRKYTVLVFLCFLVGSTTAQSVARQWNEEVLNGIRNDFARPTVHARNLFHTSVAMYDVWAVFAPYADTFFLGKTVGDYTCSFNGFSTSENLSEARNKAISYAVYRIILHRFENAPRQVEILEAVNSLMADLQYDISITSTNYENGDAAALGNYIAQQIIAFGLQDGSNEALDYGNQLYEPLNEPLNTDITGNGDMTHPNHWQPLKVENYVDQSGNVIPGGQPAFLSPEWGSVTPFSLQDEDKTIHSVSGFDYTVYSDPGAPSYLQNGLGIEDPYKWGFSLVAAWSAHLDPADGVLIDISPASKGNFDSSGFPITFEEYKSFYNYADGSDPSTGHSINPKTNLPYEPEMVLRGDYTRVLAEYWADGPDSETPPGHWFTLLNYVSDQPDLVKRFKGEGDELSDLEWDVKSYFILGGTMHDAAVTAWGLKGYYDYVRPISAIRYMADRGQSSDSDLPSYHPNGLPLVPGLIEVINLGGPLAGAFNENVGRIKMYCWKGPSFIIDPNNDIAGVDWILAEEWFPYQRPSFVSPPFAGFVSGHSTFSRAAAEFLTMLTGDPFFPGGLGVFEAPANSFLKFEKGPSTTIKLQWATYRDASDQTSLSRIWGGIHPPIDDVSGRIIGEKIGKKAFAFGEKYFIKKLAESGALFPNPTVESTTILFESNIELSVSVYDILGREVISTPAEFDAYNQCNLSTSQLRQGIYFVILRDSNDNLVFNEKLIKK
jgi:hypothetical protein